MAEIRKCLSFDDILLVPKYSELRSRSQANPASCGYSLPIVMSPMDLISTPQMIDCFTDSNLMATVHRYFKDPKEQYAYVSHCKELDKVFFAVGSIQKYKDWIDCLFNNGVHKFCIDMAHGDSILCVETVEYIKKLSPLNRVMAGNVVTKSGFEHLQKAGAEFIRVGIGGGSICSTRSSTGFGVPQLTSIEDCASRKTTAKLISDGGIKNNGDIVKAMAVGADMVMCGKMLAQTSLAGGIEYDREKNICSNFGEVPVYKQYRGMASREARSGVMNYGSVEGVSGLVPYLGTTESLIEDLKLNLHAALSYCGTTNWDDFRRCVKIIQISDSSILESKTHVIQ